MNVISETFNRGHNILELVGILPNVSFITSETESDCLFKKMENAS